MSSRSFVSASAALVVVGVAGAQVPIPVRFELRIVPQLGTLPGPITDVAGAEHAPILAGHTTSVSRTRRFEIQYRLLDLDVNDAIVPAGLAGADIQVTSTGSGVTSGSMTRRANLSDYEVRQADFNPPGSVDNSGFPVNGGTFTGIHRPFRGGLVNDGSPANGAGNALLGINPFTPISLSPTDQGNPEAGLTGLEWYGLYSFEFRAGPTAEGTRTFTVTPRVDTMLRAFAFWDNTTAFRSTDTTLFSSGSASVSFYAVPEPAAAYSLAWIGFVAGHRRRRH